MSQPAKGGRRRITFKGAIVKTKDLPCRANKSEDSGTAKWSEKTSASPETYIRLPFKNEERIYMLPDKQREKLERLCHQQTHVERIAKKFLCVEGNFFLSGSIERVKSTEEAKQARQCEVTNCKIAKIAVDGRRETGDS